MHVLTVDLGAIQKNWVILSGSSSASVAGVIKANAYGLGAGEVGQALYAVGCREFFLATLQEAVAARQLLPQNATIYLLGGLRNVSLPKLHQYNLTPVLCSHYDIEQWLRFKLSVSLNLTAALKINTGMTRFGLDEQEIARLCADQQRLIAINPGLLMSHLACADEADHPLNQAQLLRFSKALLAVKKVIPAIRASLGNSSGFFLGKQWHFDMVRPGAALYGINPTPLFENPMRQVIKLSLPILQVRTLEADIPLGYGATVSLPAGARVAVVAGGYADGIHRTLGGALYGMLDGKRVGVVGRISMDSILFDASSVRLSDDELMRASIEIIGEHVTVEQRMKAGYSLGYDVLTSIGSRYARTYIPGAP